jgi:hypothetical protein
MRLLQHAPTFFLLSALILGPHLPAQTQSDPAKTGQQAVTEERDGQHDFDFQFGRWKVHNRRLLHPLTGSNEWVEFDGTIVARPIWGGRANTDEFEADSPSGHIEGMTVRTYNPKSHQWSIYWANQKNGVFSLPPTVGKFKNGRGEFFDQEDFNGQSIFVRYLWLVPSPDSTRWEQAFSVDGGKTWETNWIMIATREKE